ncbi:MAG TPA: SH3 domain-containing protein [Marmoricola sp.]|nr:SH3 domain-containing protein [Marmoricola sp.]
MPSGRHAQPTEVRWGRRRARLALLAAPLLTLVAVGVGTAATQAPTPVRTPTADTSWAQASLTRPMTVASRVARESRSSTDRVREAATVVHLHKAPPLRVVGHQWATVPLNVWLSADPGSAVVGLVRAGHSVAVTGRVLHGFAEISDHGDSRWVHEAYLSDHKPAPPRPQPARMGLADTPCPGTESVMNGLVPAAIRAYEAVCHNFPEVTVYGGYAPRGEHANGHAVDAMTSDASVGYRIAAFLQAHAAELDIYDIIYRQHIWTPVRASEGWRLMPDRGSPTANHMDHVHFAVN